MTTVTAKDGTELYVQDWGQGPAVVLVHGWPLSADMWEYNASALVEAGHRVVAYDRRGFGRSGKPWGGYDYDTMTDDLEAVLEALDVRDAMLVGFSMGGGEVVRYLARGGARAVRGVLVAAVVPLVVKTPDNPGGVDRSVFDDIVEKLANDRPATLHTIMKAVFGVGPLTFSVSGDFIGANVALGMQASPKATIDCVRAFSETDFRADCAKVRVPVLIVHGTLDATVPIDVSARQAVRLIPGARLVEYNGEPHGLTYTARERLNAELVAFAKS